MPKATMQFDLPEEQGEYDRVLRAGAMSLALYDIVSMLRNKVKYGTPDKTLTDVYTDIWRILGEYNLDPFID